MHQTKSNRWRYLQKILWWIIGTHSNRKIYWWHVLVRISFHEENKIAHQYLLIKILILRIMSSNFSIILFILYVSKKLKSFFILDPKNHNYLYIETLLYSNMRNYETKIISMPFQKYLFNRIMKRMKKDVTKSKNNGIHVFSNHSFLLSL